MPSPRSIDDPWMEDEPAVIDENDPILKKLIGFHQLKSASIANIPSFLAGFNAAFDYRSRHVAAQALFKRGWGFNGGVPDVSNYTARAIEEMINKKMTNDQIVAELIEIEIEVYKLSKRS